MRGVMRVLIRSRLPEQIDEAVACGKIHPRAQFRLGLRFSLVPIHKPAFSGPLKGLGWGSRRDERVFAFKSAEGKGTVKRKSRFAADSPLEETEFEPSVPPG
jgi:hypothetical protein